MLPLHGSCILSMEWGESGIYRINSVINTVRQDRTATVNRLLPNQASRIPTTRANAPATGFLVASIMAGKVITARVT